MSTSANTGAEAKNLSSAKRLLFDQWVRGQAPTTDLGLGIPRRSDDGPVPLSYSQQRLWFLDQLAPGNPFYNVPAAVPLPATIVPALLELSINAIVKRHETLRTTFTMRDEQPVQVVSAELRIPLTRINLRHLSDTERRVEALRIASEEARRPFDLAKGPLLRTTLLDLGGEGFVLLLTLHHIVSDGWSMGLLFQELTALYTAFATGQPAPLPELPIQYPDYAAWQRSWLNGETLDAQVEYWEQQLQDIPVLEMPTDRPRLAVQTYRGAHYNIAFPVSLTRALQDLIRRENVTLFMALLAVFKVLLHRYTGQTDIVIGVPVSNRARAETEGLIGFFVNSLVMRTDLSGNPTYRTVLKRVRETALAAYAHQDVPFEMLVERLQPERDLSRNPLFQVTFQIVNTPVTNRGNSAGGADWLQVEQGTSIFDLAVNLWEAPDGLRGQFEYSTELFNRETIERLVRHFERLLQAIVADPDRRISEIPLLDLAERYQLVVECNRTDIAFPEDFRLHQLVESQVERTPVETAVLSEEGGMSYGALNAQANRLAYYLADNGVCSGTLVGICLERSPRMVVALLAVLKAGAAYLPLDPSYPSERLAFMIGDARPAVLITEALHFPKLPDVGPHVRIVQIDRDWNRIIAYSDCNPLNRACADDLAYVLYTSGSSGKPKAALIHHAAICNHMHWMQSRFPLVPDDVVLQRTSFSFDASIWEFFAPLIAGASLVLARPGSQPDPAYLTDLIQRERITVIQVVPTILQMLLDESRLSNCTSLKRVFCGGEPLKVDMVKRFFGQIDADLVNLYGPTEATIDTHYYVCEREIRQGSIPIGQPIANTRSYVLDAHQQIVPVGVPGELWIGGRAVGKGYLNRPDMTAEKFVSDLFSTDPNARLYRTGDLARYRADGTLELLGRIDQQVKLRGFRIELGEIEDALRSHGEVADAAAAMRDDVDRSQRLVAYVVPDKGAAPSMAELHRYLKDRLPDYMVPSAILVLESLPLTPNGKVDRRALPAPGGARPGLEASYLAPRNGVEDTLARIWAGVLGLERVGVHDNFFELGGDSILSIQIIARARQAGLHVTAQQIFQHQTVAELAAVACQAGSSEAEQGILDGPVPLTPVQAWFFEQRFAEPHHFNQSVLLTLGFGTSAPALRQVLHHLLRHHDALRLRFTADPAGIWHQRYASVPDAVPFEEIDLSDLTGQAQVASLHAHAERLQASLDLEDGPLVRMALIRGGAQPDRLLWIVHHLAVDAVSWRILLEDWQTAYGQLSRGAPVVLPAKTASWRHWAEQLHAAAPAFAEREAAFWLGAVPPVPSLPVDVADADNTVGAAGTVVSALSAADTRALLQQVPTACRVRIDEVLLTALVQTLARWSGQPLVRLDLEGHGREELEPPVDVSRTVGWFTSIYPVCLRLEAGLEPGPALRAVKEQLRRIPTRGLGYGVVRYLNAAGDLAEQLAAAPAAQLSFNYLGQFAPGAAAEADGATELAAETAGNPRSRHARRAYLLEINGSVLAGRLYMHWTHSPHHRPATIEQLARWYQENLRALIRYAQTAPADKYSPADFPYARLDQKNLDKLLSRLGPTARTRTNG
jgi:amino acid adenylation domain-containing protein/non-ribosomal peptide synthase protein (TIGR01720 family)